MAVEGSRHATAIPGASSDEDAGIVQAINVIRQFLRQHPGLREADARSRFAATEQIGGPDELYDNPANDFVMGFLGEVTQLAGVVLRPHDIDVSRTPVLAGATEAEVTRVLRVGFEVRVLVRTKADEDVTVVLTRTHAATKPQTLGLICAVAGMALWLRDLGSVGTLVLVVVLQLLTIPVAAHLVGRAAVRTGQYRQDLTEPDHLAEDMRRAGFRRMPDEEATDGR